MDVEGFLEHYGIKGMKKPTPPQKLDRIYRVAAGTAALRERMAKAKKTSIKKVKKVVQPEEDDNTPKMTPPAAEMVAKGLIGKHGATRLADIR
jgi:hypothetical protein